MEIHEDSKAFTRFCSKWGLYEFKRLPFGLCNAPASFVRMMESEFRDMNWKHIVYYLDDIVVFSDTFEEHLARLEKVFKRLQEHNLCLKRAKWFLGHTVSAAGLQPDSKKVEVIKHHPVPKGRGELKLYLGICNYYRKFIEGYAKIGHPLHDLLKKYVPS